MYTIFKNNTSIILTDNLNDKNKICFYFWEKIQLGQLLKHAEKNNIAELIFYYADLEMMWNEFEKSFVIIEAAGGIVENQSNELLFIFRNNKWDLPKGKIEKGERTDEAAIREVQEECGMENVKIEEFISKTYHIYSEKGEDILKITHWYKMFSDETDLSPQLEEAITEVVWKDKIQIREALLNTYPNIKMLVEDLKKLD